MELLPHVGWLVLGLALLSFGADWMVRGASELALRARVKPLVVGLTVVAFGTSAPELLVSLKANLDPNTQADIAVGNVVGSNICNIALLLGIAALIRPLTVSSQVVRRELPILLVVTGGFVAMIIDGKLDRWEGVVMFCGIVFYVIHSIRLARSTPEDPALADVPEEALAHAGESGLAPTLKSLGWVVLGLAGLIYGADRLVTSGVTIARVLNVPELVIGLTMVAIGTSLPELATTIAASRKGQTDIIAGNLIGSNLFNILAVMGLTSAVKALVVESLNTIDVVVMCGFTLLLVPFLMRGHRLNRIEGGILLVGYLTYCVWLVKPEWFGVTG
ncbi:sodium:calcium antiporter [Haloferula helveola]|uniref:Sodium:calcium antiporter n=1 Tax=Haloferula helveola TaxID=490095 RepID=A0ABN6H678_9BACT|nr:sodium:calcium antiporter [Haloferula helveola]